MSIQISDAELEPIIAKIFEGKPVRLLKWATQPLTIGFSTNLGTKGLYRVSGSVQSEDDVQLWSLVVKIVEPGGVMASDEPNHWGYWLREVKINQSGILDSLPGRVAAPCCLAVTEQANGSYWLWMEEIQQTSVQWTMARYRDVAHHLGEFNGAYLVDYPLPKAEPWMLWGRTRQWKEFIDLLTPQALQYLETPLIKQWFGDSGFSMVQQAWSKYGRLLDSFEQLPVCFCHHDAFYNNLLPRQRKDGSYETVLVDWALAGFGRVGEEIGVTLMLSLLYLKVAAKDVIEFEQAIFDSYIAGLKAAGWHGNPKLARLGYLTNAFLFYATWSYGSPIAFQDPKEIDRLESSLGKSIDEIVNQFAELLPFSINICNEALGLADELHN